MPPLSDSACARCGDALESPAALGSSLCRACRLAPPPFEKALSYGLYDGRLRGAIHALKYDRIQAIGRTLGGLLSQTIALLAAELPAGALLIPIPLHRGKLAQRGFNQARALAEAAIVKLRHTQPEWPVELAPRTLMRLRPTESQAGLSPRQRRINVRGAFSVSDPAAVTGKDVILIDDIMTTGATARAAAHTLRRAGAASVHVATLARARASNGAFAHKAYAAQYAGKEKPAQERAFIRSFSSEGEWECR
jgi:ComF family protein